LTIDAEIYTFQGLDQLYETADQLPEASRHEVYGHHEELDEWEEIPYRNSLWTDDGRVTGDISASEDWYNIIQYGDILETVGDAVRQHQDDMDITVTGTAALSPSAHKMSAQIDFDGDPTVYADEDDPITLGLKVRSGHSGFHGVKYDIGAERQVCSNGMMGFVSDLHFEQTHSDPFQPGLAYHAVDAVIDNPDTVEQRINDAQNRELMNQDEALLLLMDVGLDRYLDNPVPDLVNAMHDEVDDPDSPTLWETYNTATRALTHYTRDVPDYELDHGFEQAARLLDTGHSELPEPRQLGQDVVEQRVNRFVEDDDIQPYWDGEEDALHELMELHDASA